MLASDYVILNPPEMLNCIEGAANRRGANWGYLIVSLFQSFLRRMGEEMDGETQETLDTLPVPKQEEVVKKEGKRSRV